MTPEKPEDQLRIGVFVCRCGINIASTVQVPDVVEKIVDIPGVVYAGENLWKHPLPREMPSGPLQRNATA